jgi:hypothetical protein
VKKGNIRLNSLPFLFMTGIFILLVSCNPHGKQQIFPLELVQRSMDVSPMAVSVREVARYSPPDGRIWPTEKDVTATTICIGNRLEALAVSTGEVDGITGQSDSGVWASCSWNLSTNDYKSVPLDPQPPEGVYEAFISSDWHYLIDPGGRSQSFQISTAGEIFNAPIIKQFYIYSFNKSLVKTIPVDTSAYELLPDTMMLAMDSNLSNISAVIFKDAQRVPIKAGEVTKLVENWLRLDLRTNTLEPVVDGLVNGNPAVPTSHISYYGRWLFLAGQTSDGNECEYAVDEYNSVFYVLPNYTMPGSSDNAVNPIKITDILPEVEYQNSLFVFADFGEAAPGKKYIVALRIVDGALDKRLVVGQENKPRYEFNVIWASEIPDIFSERIVVIGQNNRPYILALDTLHGNLTVFDPLLGSIQAQTRISYQSQVVLYSAKFCIPENPSAGDHIFIHDPNANQIIELALEFSEPGSSRHITPLETPPAG